MSLSLSGRRLSKLLIWRQSITNALITVAVTLAIVPQPVLCQLAFAGSCNVKTAQLSGHYLGLYCNNLDTLSFGYNWTWIDLNACVANSHGKLVGKKNGNFHASCSHCSTSLAHPQHNSRAAGMTGFEAYTNGLTLGLKCNCRNGHGSLDTTSSLDLNTVLVDFDGAMGCYGRLGNKTLRGPLPRH